MIKERNRRVTSLGEQCRGKDDNLQLVTLFKCWFFLRCSIGYILLSIGFSLDMKIDPDILFLQIFKSGFSKLVKYLIFINDNRFQGIENISNFLKVTF